MLSSHGFAAHVSVAGRFDVPRSHGFGRVQWNRSLGEHAVTLSQVSVACAHGASWSLDLLCTCAGSSRHGHPAHAYACACVVAVSS